jgi:hypothetical protein
LAEGDGNSSRAASTQPGARVGFGLGSGVGGSVVCGIGHVVVSVSMQTLWSPSQLMPQPEHVNDDARRALKTTRRIMTTSALERRTSYGTTLASRAGNALPAR